MPVIDYYMALNSPWTYLGAARFTAIARRHDAVVNVKPTRFAEVFAATGGLPLPKRSAQRQAYRMMELKRWRDHLKVPIVLEPPYFPADETAGARLVMVAQLAGWDALALSREIGRAMWELEHNIAEEAVLRAAAKRAGLDYDEIERARPEHGDIDAIWESNTSEAINRGVFGAPSYVIESGEIFWGQDRLEFLDRALAA